MGRFLLVTAAINGVVDGLMLIAAGYLTHWQINWKRLLLAVTAGMAYVSICMWSDFGLLNKTLVRICVLTLMGCIAYGFQLPSCRQTAVFVLLSMSMGTVASGLERGDFLWLVLSASILALICLIGFGGGQGREYVSVTIPNGTQTVSVTALIDTGNTLTDPITGHGVIVVGADVAARLFGLTDEELSCPLDTIVKHRGLRLIPYKTVGQPGAMLLGKAVEGVRIGNQRKKCVIAFAPNRIGGNRFNALLGGSV